MTLREKTRGVLLYGGPMSKVNPRYKNGHLRRKYRGRLKAIGGPCGICKGRLGPIHYDEPSDADHPLSFVVDEIIPVSRWKEYGYPSPEAVAQDWNNLQSAHFCCNAAKSNKTVDDLKKIIRKVNVKDGDW
jgi:5-methylcytosine-specific restriction endonuclease McrA